MTSPNDESEWEEIRTFFPLFMALMATEGPASVLVVGASDGKFVLPLAAQGVAVTALDVDEEALLTGPKSLSRRAAAQDLAMQVECVHGDIRDIDLGEFDAVWTSCSWHYSRNFDRPLSDFIDAIKRHTRPGGILAAEYMMPLEVRHLAAEHYLEPGEVWSYIGSWQRLWDAYTSVYFEDSHPGQPSRHVHRMGLAIARKPIVDESFGP